jgi:hypothetical protein
MGFLAPWLLAGVAAVGLPIYLHLLRQHRTTPKPFSSLMFFERRIQSSIQHRRLKYRVLLALRALFLILLMLAFGRPYLESTGIASAHGGRVLALLIDDSFSMRQDDRLDRAKRDALQVAGGMRAADRAQVIAFGGRTRLLTNLIGDRATIESSIRSIEPGDGASAFAEVARAVRSLAQSAKSPVEAHLFSDMQKSSAPSNFADLKLPEGTQLIPHPAADGAIPNFAVENVIAPRRLFIAKSGTVEATIVSYADRDTQKRVTLLLNNHPIEMKAVQVPAGGRATVQFTAFDAPYGLNRGEVRIDSSDSFPQDDHFYFAVERSDPAPALFIHDAGDTRSATYFETALGAANQPAFNLIASSYAQASTMSLDRFAFVVLSDPAPLTGGLNESLREYVVHGGSLLVLLGRRAEGRVPIANLSIGRSDGPGRDGEFMSVASADATHPALRINGRWDGIRFFRAQRVAPEQARVLMTLDDGSPLLVERPVGEGRVMVLTSALDNLDNDLPVNPMFVPFVQRVTGYLGRVETATGNYTAGTFYDLRPGDVESAAPIEVTGPHGERVLSLVESTRTRSLPLDHEGFYDIRRQSGRHELAAVNPDRRESDFTILAPDTIALWKNTGMDARAAGSGSETTQNKNELWWYVLLCALGMAIAESVLGNRHLDMKEGTT